MVRTVELSPRKVALDPPEELLVVGVHPQSNLWLTAVTTEVTFTGKDSKKVADLELLLFHRQVSRET